MKSTLTNLLESPPAQAAKAQAEAQITRQLNKAANQFNELGYQINCITAQQAVDLHNKFFSPQTNVTKNNRRIR